MNPDETFRRALFRLNGRVVHLRPRGTPKGNALLSYTTLPFLNRDPAILGAHTNRWECRAMSETLATHGYNVDIIDFENTAFIPNKQYSLVLDVGSNLERLAIYLPHDCIRIFHATTSYWQFNNEAEKRRLADFQKRRRVTIAPERLIPPNRSAECADQILLLGNDATEQTYAHLQKPIHHVPISTTHLFDFPEHKPIEQARTSFVWIGGAGLIHKGVDLLIEAFAKMPEYRLHLCGKLDESDVTAAYAAELALPNISAHGMLDLGSQPFKNIADSSIAVMSASCAEGQSGSVIVGMHAGLIPIVSRETGVDTHDFGVTLSDTTVEYIMRAAHDLAREPARQLRSRVLRSWRHVRKHHTRPTFLASFDAFLGQLERSASLPANPTRE